MLTRRHLLLNATALSVGAFLTHAADATAATLPTLARGAKVTHTPAEWRARLTPEQFNVLREEGTEHPFTSALNHERRPGTFVCVACDLALFNSSTKYDSGTGWPSFYRSLAGAFDYRQDHELFLPRTEYHCARCGGHHGHVFDDGPQPTGKRYCNNGVCLKFIPATK